MFIQTESTPNPATLKFLPGLTVLETGTADFPSAEAADASPLARRIFAVDQVRGVFFGTDFVTVTKAEDAEWDHVKPAILGAIMEHFQSGAPVMEGEAQAAGGHAEHDGEDGEIVGQIKTLLDTRVRPAVAQDGGDITFHGFDRGIVYDEEGEFLGAVIRLRREAAADLVDVFVDERVFDDRAAGADADHDLPPQPGFVRLGQHCIGRASHVGETDVVVGTGSARKDEQRGSQGEQNFDRRVKGESPLVQVFDLVVSDPFPDCTRSRAVRPQIHAAQTFQNVT